ncbi:MAG: hypothetical protein AAGI53_09435 [Planctomycetota bacterium]
MKMVHWLIAGGLALVCGGCGLLELTQAELEAERLLADAQAEVARLEAELLATDGRVVALTADLEAAVETGGDAQRLRLELAEKRLDAEMLRSQLDASVEDERQASAAAELARVEAEHHAGAVTGLVDDVQAVATWLGVPTMGLGAVGAALVARRRGVAQLLNALQAGDRGGLGGLDLRDDPNAVESLEDELSRQGATGVLRQVRAIKRRGHLRRAQLD